MPQYEDQLPSLFYPTASNEVTNGGKIIRVQGSIATAASHSVVTVDRGSLQGAKVGQIFSIFQQGEIVRDPKTKEAIKLPSQRVGTLMLFKTFDQLSYGYILDSSLPIKIGAEIQPPNSTDE